MKSSSAKIYRINVRHQAKLVFADTMSVMSKSFMLMAETMKVSMHQMTMIQQKQQHSMATINNNNQQQSTNP